VIVFEIVCAAALQMTRKHDEARGSANAQSNEGLTMGVVDRSAAGRTGAMINLKNLLAHKIDAPCCTDRFR
jgi:hypothetical protein